MSRAITVSRTRAWLLVVLVLVNACSEPPFAHTNPLDPEFQGSYVLTGGTDTLSATLVFFQMHVEGTPPLSPTIRVEWSSSHSRLHVGALGSVFAEPTLRPTVGTITATIGPHQAHRSFVMLQRAASIVTTCRTSTPCDTVDALGDEFAFAVQGTDIYGRNLIDIPFALSEKPSLIRDPSVLASVVAIDEDRRRFRTLANGSTWITIDLGSYRDSVRVVVRQRPAAWDNLCPETVEVGETTQLRAHNFHDRNGFPYDVDKLGFPQVEWLPGHALQDGANATVDPAGNITGVAAGEWVTVSFFRGFGQSMACVVTIVDP